MIDPIKIKKAVYITRNKQCLDTDKFMTFDNNIDAGIKMNTPSPAKSPIIINSPNMSL